MASDLGVAHLEAIAVAPEPDDAVPPPPVVFARADTIMVPGAAGGPPVMVIAPSAEKRAATAAFLAAHPAERGRIAVAAPRVIRRALIERWAPALGRRAVRTMLDRDPALSAARLPRLGRPLLAVAAVLALATATLGSPAPLTATWTFVFLLIGLFRLLVAETGQPPPPPPLADADLPRFAVLVPIHREEAVVADLVAALSRLDYPADRLDLRLVVEADDLATRAAAERAVAGTAVDMVIVPPSLPRTKPKALDFALATVDADFVTVYDAEDRPDPDQLRRAAGAFALGSDDLAVVQAALEIDHAADARPWLVRQFEIEYAMLFHGLLPWLAERRLFLPLGGTSNHFRRDALLAVGGWDPHNVTEDADVAVRLVRAGWHAGVVASATREEAPTDLAAWFAQRTRWMKGWMQTWFTHMRRPRRLHAEMDLRDAVAVHIVLAGQVLSAATFLPSLVLVALQLAGVLPLFHDSGIDEDVLTVAALAAFGTGLVGALILALTVASRVGRRFRLVDLATMPLYRCAISLATYAAIVELLRAPARWNKTPHGLAARLAEEGEATTSRPPDDREGLHGAPAEG